MNTKFRNYLDNLTPMRRDIAAEAVKVFLDGESSNVEFFRSATDAFTFCRDLSLEEIEHAEVLLLRQNGKLIKRVRIASGGLDCTIVDVRVVLREALLNNATQIILIHNHPSGSTKPSRYDDELTKNVANGCKAVNIRMLDHVIICGNAYYSYSENDNL